MALSNAQIAAEIGKLATLLRDQGANRYKVKAYRSAADALQSYPEHLSEIVKRGRPLPKIPGVGKSIGSAIVEIVKSGTLERLKGLDEKYPPGAAVIAEAARLTMREAQRLVRELGVGTAAELKAKLNAGKVASAVGESLEFKVRQGLVESRRLLRHRAVELAEQIRGALLIVKGVEAAEVVGSLRRGRETVGSIRFVVRTRNRPTLLKALRRHGGVDGMQEESANRVTFRLAAGPLLVVRLAESADWGSSLVEETGSLAHLAEVKAHAGMPRKKSATEEGWYELRDLPWIAPELREGRGEVTAAAAGKLPELVTLDDIRGDLHAHTTESDGANTLEQMVRAARLRGYEYLAITDHSKSLKITNGLDEARLEAQGKQIDALNRTLTDFRVLKGSEVDILENGTLDFDDRVLARLDIVMASIHSRFSLGREEQTKRLLRAIRNPFVTCIGHLTGRKLLKRAGYELDIDRVLKAIKRYGKVLEINSSPDRLDVSDEVAFKARALGIPLLINTDAHSVKEFGFMPYGVIQARRGWQSRQTIVNTLPLRELLRGIQAMRRIGTRR